MTEAGLMEFINVKLGSFWGNPCDCSYCSWSMVILWVWNLEKDNFAAHDWDCAVVLIL